MSKSEVWTCDVCDRELPLRGKRGQTIKTVDVKWHWPLSKPIQWEPQHICEDCWEPMVKAAQALREEGTPDE